MCCKLKRFYSSCSFRIYIYRVLSIRMQQWLAQLRSYFSTIPISRYSKTFITASIGVIGISIAASYYFDIFASRNKKRIRNNKQKLIQTVSFNIFCVHKIYSKLICDLGCLDTPTRKFKCTHQESEPC